MSTFPNELPIHALFLLKRIQYNPSTRNIKKFIKNLTEVKNKRGCLFCLRCKKNDFINHEHTYKELTKLKYGNDILSRSKVKLINKAIIKNNRHLKEVPLVMRAINVSHYKDFMKESNIDPLEQKMPVAFSIFPLNNRPLDHRLLSKGANLPPRQRITPYYSNQQLQKIFVTHRSVNMDLYNSIDIGVKKNDCTEC
ncbi:hypothetical protein SC206_07150 [Rouxiella sp. T17]|uniref:hypothetical protein n=1 Tax=Rouxiella sp. T17 TaxID=3085684 RepID=UPI002FCC0DC7